MARLLPIISIFLVTLLYQHQPVEGIAFLTVVKAAKYAYKVYEYCETIGKFLRVPGEEVFSATGVDAKLLGTLDDISTDIQSLRAHLDDKISKLPTELSTATSKLFQLVNKVHLKYEKFLYYVRDINKYEEYTLKKFADTVTDDNVNEMSGIIADMHVIFAGSKLGDLGEKNILKLLVDSSPSEQICSVGQSLQQVILNLYQTIVLTEMEGLAATLFSYKYLGKMKAENTTNNREYFVKEKKDALELLKKRVNNTYVKTKGAIRALNDESREFYKCDPKYQIEDKTYSKMQDVFQDYIINEADMKNYDNCENHCEELTNIEEQCTTNFCKENKKKCSGTNRICKKVDKEYTLCLADEESNRRYEWITTANQTVYGQSRKTSSCDNSITLEATTNFFPHHKCEYCICTCESDDKEIVRYISMREVRSDTDNGKVITGVRLHKENNTFYIQIQEGQIQPNGSINTATVDWTPIKPETEYAHVGSPHQYDFKVDYYSDTVLLDDVKAASNNRVLTGIRFRYGQRSALRLEIETTEFDFQKGIFIGNGQWQHNDNPTKKPRKAIDLTKLDEPLKASKNEEFSKSGQLVKFRQSDRVKDLGQNTIPFIDVQSVAPLLPVPLMGAGLYHKGSGKTGGFLGLKVFTFDFTSYFDD